MTWLVVVVVSEIPIEFRVFKGSRFVPQQANPPVRHRPGRITRAGYVAQNIECVHSYTSQRRGREQAITFGAVVRAGRLAIAELHVCPEHLRLVPELSRGLRE